MHPFFQDLKQGSQKLGLDLSEEALNLCIFVRLFERDGKSGYLKDLPRVMWYLLEESKPYAELQPFMQFICDKVMPKFEAKYGKYEVVAA